MKTVLIAATVLALVGGAAQAATPSFTSDVAPILQKNCLGCHSSAAKIGGLAMDKFDLLMKGGAHGPVIVPGKSEESRMVMMLEGKVQPRMPFGSDPLSATDIATIKAWIDAGSVGPAAGEATALAPLAIPDIKPEVRVVSPIASLRFSPDGKILAVGAYREVRLIDPATNKLLATLPGHADYVRSIAFSPDGKMLAAGSYDKLVKLWDVASGKELRNLQDHIDAVFAVAFSPDGKRLASAWQDRTVKIWDVASGKRLYTLGDASDGLTSLHYSPKGDRIAAAGYDKTIYVWRLGDSDSSLVQSLIADEDSILALVWTPNEKTIITSSSDGSIRFHDAATLDPLRVIDHQPDWVQALSITPDGTRLAAGRYNGSLTLYNTKAQNAPQRELRADGSAGLMGIRGTR